MKKISFKKAAAILAIVIGGLAIGILIGVLCDPVENVNAEVSVNTAGDWEDIVFDFGDSILFTIEEPSIEYNTDYGYMNIPKGTLNNHFSSIVRPVIFQDWRQVSEELWEKNFLDEAHLNTNSFMFRVFLPYTVRLKESQIKDFEGKYKLMGKAPRWRYVRDRFYSGSGGLRIDDSNNLEQRLVFVFGNAEKNVEVIINGLFSEE